MALVQKTQIYFRLTVGQKFVFCTIDQNLYLKILFQCNNLPIYDSVDVKKVTKSSNIKFVVIDIEIVIAIDLSNSNRYCHL